VRLCILVLLALLPSFALILYSAAMQRRQDIAEVQETALRLARLASSEQGRRLAGTQELLIALAQVPEIRRGDTPACNALLQRLLKGYQLYVNFGVIAPDGRLVCSALPISAPMNLADRSYFRRAMTSRSFALGDYQIGRLTGRATINVAYPVQEDTQTIVGVVFAAIDLAALNDIVRQANLPEGSTLTITDGQGTILVRYPDADRWVGKSLPDAPTIAVVRTLHAGVAEAINLDGVSALLGFTPLLDRPDSGDVYVSVGIPKRAAVASANRHLLFNLLGLGGVAALGFGAAFVASGAFVLRPVHRLLAGTRRVAAGGLNVRLPERGGGELEELTHAFNEMTAALERDQAEREETQRQLHAQRDSLYRSEKLAAIGRLAAGVAHELRNPLSVVGGRIELLRLALAAGRTPDAPTLSKHVTQLREASTRMHSIMEGLSTSSKPSKPEPQVLDLDQLLAGIRELVAYEARSANVAVRRELEEAGLTARGDRSHLTQILLNLATNAVQAMAGRGGELVLRARHGLDKHEVVVEVADTGPGIAADHLEKIWDAFYTTKAEGTGLGLAIVRSLVEENGGHINVVSEVGKGTVFTVVLSTPTE
jgi:C4-dicarboxylate-specific signal transduction histidine kinase